MNKLTIDGLIFLLSMFVFLACYRAAGKEYMDDEAKLATTIVQAATAGGFLALLLWH